MGFRNNAYATVWEVTPRYDNLTRARISITRRNKNTDQYEQEFSGFVDFVGTAAAGSALKLRPKDRIRLGDTDVTTRYDKEKNITYTNFKVFSFERSAAPHGGNEEPRNNDVDSGEINDDLPF